MMIDTYVLPARTCRVGLNTSACLAPAGTRERSITTTCTSCGQDACANCTEVRDYDGTGEKRICNDCLDEMRHHGDLR